MIPTAWAALHSSRLRRGRPPSESWGRGPPATSSGTTSPPPWPSGSTPHLPGVRLLAVLRHPVDRAASAHRHHVAWGNLAGRLVDWSMSSVVPEGDRHDPPYIAGWGGPQTLDLRRVVRRLPGARTSPASATACSCCCTTTCVADPEATYALGGRPTSGYRSGDTPADLAEVRFSTRPGRNDGRRSASGAAATVPGTARQPSGALRRRARATLVATSPRTWPSWSELLDRDLSALAARADGGHTSAERDHLEGRIGQLVGQQRPHVDHALSVAGGVEPVDAARDRSPRRPADTVAAVGLQGDVLGRSGRRCGDRSPATPATGWPSAPPSSGHRSADWPVMIEGLVGFEGVPDAGVLVVGGRIGRARQLEQEVLELGGGFLVVAVPDGERGPRHERFVRRAGSSCGRWW